MRIFDPMSSSGRLGFATPLERNEHDRLVSQVFKAFEGYRDRDWPDEDAGDKQHFIDVDDDLEFFEKRVYITTYNVDNYRNPLTLGGWKDKIQELIDEYGEDCVIKPGGSWMGGPPCVVRKVPLSDEQRAAVKAFVDWKVDFYARKKEQDEQERLQRHIWALEDQGYIVTKKEEANA